MIVCRGTIRTVHCDVLCMVSVTRIDYFFQHICFGPKTMGLWTLFKLFVIDVYTPQLHETVDNNKMLSNRFGLVKIFNPVEAAALPEQ